jgi:hypothetical protein
MFPFTVVPAYNLPVYASQRPLPDATQDSVRGCLLGFAAAVIADGRLQRACKAQPVQIPACAANAPGSSLGQNHAMDGLVPLVVRRAAMISDRRGHIGSVSEPRPPNGCSPWVRPFPPRLPPGVAPPCSFASQVSGRRRRPLKGSPPSATQTERTASEALPPLLDTAPLIRAPRGLQLP